METNTQINMKKLSRVKQIKIQQWICVNIYNLIGLALKIHGWVTDLTINYIALF